MRSVERESLVRTAGAKVECVWVRKGSCWRHDTSCTLNTRKRVTSFRRRKEWLKPGVDYLFDFAYRKFTSPMVLTQGFLFGQVSHLLNPPIKEWWRYVSPSLGLHQSQQSETDEASERAIRISIIPLPVFVWCSEISFFLFWIHL